MELLELVKKLVSFNTVTLESSTGEMAAFIYSYLNQIGFRVKQYPYLDKNGMLKINMVAVKGDPSKKTRLALSGHMDTVTLNGWSATKKGAHEKTNPLELTFIDNKWYGRGIADMKLFLAIAIKAGEAIQESELEYPFALCFTSDEEFGCLGVKKLFQEKDFKISPPAEWIVIGEPTEMNPLTAHKGYIYKTVSLVADKIGGHSSNPQNGINVINKALPALLEKLSELRSQLESIRDRRFNPPFPTMNIGVVTTDGKTRDQNKRQDVEIKSSKNIIPGYCRIELEIRPVPGQDVQEIVSVFEHLVISSLRGSNISVRIDEGNQRAPSLPMETPEESPLVKIVKEISNKETGAESFNTEGGIFNKKGCHSVIWGPGSIRQAHRPDEYVDNCYIQQETVDAYTELIRRACCQKE